MVHPQNSHVCPSPESTLVNGFGCLIKDLHKRDRPACSPARGADKVILRPYLRKGKPCTATAFMNERGLLDGLENLLDRVFDRQNETCRKLLHLPARIHKGRGVWQKFQLR